MRAPFCSAAALLVATVGHAEAQVADRLPWSIWQDGSGNSIVVQSPSAGAGQVRAAPRQSRDQAGEPAGAGMEDTIRPAPSSGTGMRNRDTRSTPRAGGAMGGQRAGGPVDQALEGGRARPGTPAAGLPGDDQGGTRPVAESGPGEGFGPVGETRPGIPEGTPDEQASPSGQAQDVAQPEAGSTENSLLPTEPRGEMKAQIRGDRRVASIEQASPFKRCIVRPSRTMTDPLPPLIKHPGIRSVEEYEPEADVQNMQGLTAEVPVPPPPRARQLAPEPSPPIDRKSEFLLTALYNSLMGLRSAQLAATQASERHIRMLAERIIYDQKVMNRDLWAIGDCYGIDLPKQLPPYLEDEIATLGMLSGPAFDHRYLLLTIELDQQALYAFDQQTRHTDDLMIMMFSRTYAPVIHLHMAHASSLVTTLAPVAGAAFDGPVAYFERPDFLGRTWSRGVPALQVRGPTPGEINIMPTNPQPATAGSHSVPVDQQIARGGPGTGTQTATVAVGLGNTVPANPDPPYRAGVPQHAGSIGLQPPSPEVQAQIEALEGLEGAAVITPEDLPVGTVTGVQIRNNRPDLGTIWVRTDREWSLAEGNYAVPLGSVAIEDGVVIADMEALLERGLIYSMERPVTAPPIQGGNAPRVAVSPVWTAKGGFGWWNQGR